MPAPCVPTRLKSPKRRRRAMAWRTCCPRFASASQRLQFLESKLKMEECRRNNPTLAGICHFNAMDANPSPQGIFTEFYQLKYADSARWRQTNGDTVLLAGLDAASARARRG